MYVFLKKVIQMSKTSLECRKSTLWSKPQLTIEQNRLNMQAVPLAGRILLASRDPIS